MRSNPAKAFLVAASFCFASMAQATAAAPSTEPADAALAWNIRCSVAQSGLAKLTRLEVDGDVLRDERDTLLR